MSLRNLAESYGRWKGAVVDPDPQHAAEFGAWLSQYEVPLASLPPPWGQPGHVPSSDGEGGYSAVWFPLGEFVLGCPLGHSVVPVGYRLPASALEAMPRVFLSP